jgi:hypothetical protein
LHQAILTSRGEHEAVRGEGQYGDLALMGVWDTPAELMGKQRGDAYFSLYICVSQQEVCE